MSTGPSKLPNQFRILAEETQEYAICMLGPEGHVRSWNSGARQIKGYAEEEILGKHFSAFYPKEEVEAGRPEEALAIAVREGEWTGEGWRIRKDDSRFWARVTITALTGENGELKGFAKVTRDLTDRRRREEELQRETALLRLTQQVTRIANEAEGLEEALEETISAICEHVGWPVGHVYWRSPTEKHNDGAPPLVSGNLWHLPGEGQPGEGQPGEDQSGTGQFEAFRQVTEAANFDVGESLPGLVADRSGPVWIEDVTTDENFVRSEKAENLGVKSAFAVPVVLSEEMGEETVAVLEFFSDQCQERDEKLMEAVASAGVQVSRVAEREAARRALRESEQRYRRLFEEALEGVAITSPEGGVLEANPAARKILGYEPEDISELNVGEVYANPAERKRISAELRRTRSVPRREARFLRKNGEEIICEISVTAGRGGEGSQEEGSREEEEPEVYQTFFRDVTERKEAEKALRESEAKFRALAEGALVGIGLIQEGRYEYLNPALAEITGYSREKLIGKSPKLFVHPADWPKVKKQIQRRIEGEAQVVHYETRIQTRSGEIRHIKVAGNRVTYRGRPAAIATIQDVTEERRLQRDVLEVQEKERRRLGQDLHDGVASQLTGARLMLDRLKAEIEGDQFEGAETESNQIEGKKAELARRIEKVEEMVRKSGEDLRRVSRGLNPLVLEEGGLLAAIERLAKNTDGCRVERAGPVEELSELSDEDETHCYWLVQEAAVNARRHGEAGEIAIRMRREESVLTVEVEDDGRGFDPSESVQEGLGLRTMQYRADLLGADLRVESSPGEGTTVRCRLPL